VHYKSTNKTFSISWQLSQRVTISSERFQSSLSTHWPLSFCEVILLAYATQHLLFSGSTLILCILQLPQYAGMSIDSACGGRL